ncbi:MAG: hypothetical protein KDB12_14930 [Ilumatobacter sp.]|jgi:hypothetical protein|nr:hypothetical protein [Ilumatobacter sp.]
MVTLTNTTSRSLLVPGVGVLQPGESCDVPRKPDQLTALEGAVTVTQAARRRTKEK